MPITKLHPTFTFDEDRLAQLRAVVPEAFADGRINWETLRAALGEHLEDDEADAEHFGLFWPGKRAARRLASQPSRGTLVPQPGLGVNEATTRNLFIEGDNLEVLKLLLKSYAGQVKLIYIDPPYNTGNDFIYSDDFTEPLEAYLRRTGQVDEEGRALTTNSRASGRFHSNWLSMMYPRLLLARQLLREDGVIFVSIDDNEMALLRVIMGEIFGEENLLGPFVWKRRSGSNDARDNISVDHEYVLIARRSEDYQFGGIKKEFANYKNPDNDPRGAWTAGDLTCNKTAEQRPNLYYPITDPDTGVVYQANPNRVWAYEPEHMRRIIEERKVLWPRDGTRDGKGMPQYKRHLSEVRSETKPVSTWIESTSRDRKDIQIESDMDHVIIGQVGLNQQGTKEMRSLFDTQVFDYPKPVSLIQFLVEQATIFDEDAIVVDFFAGSGTTAQSVMELNRKDSGNRRFIVIQLPEPTPISSAARSAGFATIADIGRERIRRVIARMQAEAAGQETTDADRPAPDLGFKCYRLARSHFKAWQDYTGEQAAELETLFTQFESPLVESWEPSALLTELLLLEGFPLDSRVRPLPAFTANTLLEVSSDFCAHRLTVCLDARLHPETLAALDLRAEDTFICLESALDDEAKLRLADRCNLKVV